MGYCLLIRIAQENHICLNMLRLLYPEDTTVRELLMITGSEQNLWFPIICTCMSNLAKSNWMHLSIMERAFCLLDPKLSTYYIRLHRIEQSLRFSYHANIIPHAGKAPDVISEGSRTKVTSEKDSCRSFVQRRDLIAMATNKQIELSWSYSEY